MDFYILTPENQTKYLALEKKMFGKRKFKLANACTSLHIPFYEGMMWWPHMLKNHTSPVPATPASAMQPAPAPELCPSCGLQKHAVKNTDECRDVFHHV